MISSMSNKKKIIARDIVFKMIELSNLAVDKKQESYFTKQFNETLKIIDKLKRLDTSKVKGTYHVTGSKNIFRKDIVEKERMFSQKEALSNAKNSHKGYFIVKAIFHEE